MVSNPCCCMTLRTGGLVIGILEIICNSLFLILSSIALGGIFVVISVDNNGTLAKNLTEQIQKNHEGLYGTSSDQGLNMLTILMGLLIVLCVIKLIMSSLLIYGIRKEKLYFLKIWMIFRASCLVFSFLITILVSATEAKKAGRKFNSNMPSYFLYCLEIYFIYVVYRLFIELRGGLSLRPKPKYEVS